MHAGPEVVHGTCVALGRRAALLRGPSGSGKSDLALRFLFLARRGPAAPDAPALVADDQVRLMCDGSRILASPPEGIGGQMEVRGLGIVGTRPVVDAELVVVVDLVEPAQIERLPDPAETVTILGAKIPLLRLAPFEGSAPMKLALAIARAGRG